MATIFVTTPASVAEVATSPLFINISKRLSENGGGVFEVKVSALMETTPVLCIVMVKELQAHSPKEKETKETCEALKKEITAQLEEGGYIVMEGTVSEANSQRFSVPVETVVDDTKKLKKPVPKKKEKA